MCQVRRALEPRHSGRPSLEEPQRTYYVAAEYIDHSDRLLVEDGETIELYSLDLRLAQHWYAQAWRGERLDLAPFKTQRLDWEIEPEQAEHIKSSGLVLAQCVRHREGMPIVEVQWSPRVWFCRGYSHRRGVPCGAWAFD